MQFFVLNHALSEVVTIMEQIFNWHRLKPLSGCDISGEQSTKHSDAECNSESSQLIPSLLVRCAQRLWPITNRNIVAESFPNTRSDNSRDESSNHTWNGVQIENSAGIV